MPAEPDQWRIVPASSARRDLRALPEKVAAAIVEFIDGPLRSNPYRLGKELRGPLAGFYSGRRGEYRVIHRLQPANKTIEVVHVMHRRDAYRRR